MGYDLSPASRAAKRMSVSQRLGGEMPASHFSYSFCHAPVVVWRTAVLSVALTLLILDNSGIIGYSCVVRLADG
jgi:hypothetical protein